MTDEQSQVVDYRNLKLERKGLNIAIAAFVFIVALTLIADGVVWRCYGGLPALDAALVAQGTFALPVVAGLAALGAGYGFFRTTYPGIPLFGGPPDDLEKTLDELGAPSESGAVSPSATDRVSVSAVSSPAFSNINEIGEDRSAPSSDRT